MKALLLSLFFVLMIGCATDDRANSTQYGSPAQVVGSERIDIGNAPPRCIKQVAPEYPLALAEEGIEGVVSLDLIVDQDGDAIDVKIVKASHPLLGAAAVEAIKQWKFIPGMYEGKPVKTKVAIDIPFSIEELKRRD